jgi:nucleoid DNA-binding protein
MDHQQVVELIVKHGDVTKQSAERSLAALAAVIAAGMRAKETVIIRRLGRFIPYRTQAGTGTSNLDGSVWVSEGKNKVRFKVAAHLNNRMNKDTY